MSITKVQFTGDLMAALTYAVYGTAENRRKGVVRAPEVSVVSSGPSRDVYDTALAMRSEVLRHPGRTTQAVLIIQAWEPSELDKDDPMDVLKANWAGKELASRVAPDSDVIVATHTDGKSGHVHNHIIIANHDYATGKTPRGARNWHRVKHTNDALMRELNLKVASREEVSFGYAERIALMQGRTIDASDLGLDDIDQDTWRDYLRQRIEDALSDERFGDCTDGTNALSLMESIAPEYGVSFQLRHTKKGAAYSQFALLDGDSEVVYVPTKQGMRKCGCSGKKLGSDYTAEALQQRLEETVVQLQKQAQEEDALFNKLFIELNTETVPEMEEYHGTEQAEEVCGVTIPGEGFESDGDSRGDDVPIQKSRDVQRDRARADQDRRREISQLRAQIERAGRSVRENDRGDQGAPTGDGSSRRDTTRGGRRVNSGVGERRTGATKRGRSHRDTTQRVSPDERAAGGRHKDGGWRTDSIPGFGESTDLRPGGSSEVSDKRHRGEEAGFGF